LSNRFRLFRIGPPAGKNRRGFSGRIVREKNYLQVRLVDPALHFVKSNHMRSNRRTFIRHAGTAAMGLTFGGGWAVSFGGEKDFEPGVQLFTLMSVIDQDTRGTLAQVAELGYRNIESAFSRQGGFYGRSASEFAALLEDVGLTWRAHHVVGAPFRPRQGRPVSTDENGQPRRPPAMKNLRDDAQEIVDSLAEGGVRYLVCANIPASTTEEVAEAVRILTQAGETCRKAGLQLVYHNHDWEFKTVGDNTPYEVFLSEVPAELMRMELDLAWVTKAGVDPVELFRKHPGRFPLWHVKDIDADLLTLRPVGQGSIDFKRIFQEAGTAGLVYPFVEHDMPSDPLASLSDSIRYLKSDILR
jgi:sugar phosphate isomerase/epimerase